MNKWSFSTTLTQTVPILCYKLFTKHTTNHILLSLLAPYSVAHILLTFHYYKNWTYPIFSQISRSQAIGDWGRNDKFTRIHLQKHKCNSSGWSSSDDEWQTLWEKEVKRVTVSQGYSQGKNYTSLGEKKRKQTNSKPFRVWSLCATGIIPFHSYHKRTMV